MERMPLKRLSGPGIWSLPSNRSNILESLPVDISPHAVLKRLGRGVNEKKWSRLVEKICAEHADRIRPRGMYRLAMCRRNGEAIEISDRHSFTSSFLRAKLPRPTLAAVFLVTIGPELSREIVAATMRQKNRVAFILDCLGSNAAESAAAAIHRHVERRLGIRMSRYSPGYNDWNISEQEILFDFIGRNKAGEIGVQLTSDYMMSPRKSVSGIIMPRVEAFPKAFTSRRVAHAATASFGP
jgi:cobalamin-dependent methionine synthase I